MLRNNASSDVCKKMSVSERDGPGHWAVLHKTAYNAKSRQDEEFVVQSLWNLSKTFRCAECRSHMKAYLTSNDPSRYIGREIDGIPHRGMFLYLFEFHNAVNQRLGKQLMGWREALDLYSRDESTCKDKCALGPVQAKGEPSEDAMVLKPSRR